MKNLMVFLIFTILVVFSSQVYSQGDVSLHFGPSFPTGDFGDDNVEDFHDGAGLAGMGFGIGLNYIYPLTETGLGLYFGSDVIINPVAKDAKDDVEDLAGSASEFTFFNYINVPVSTGLDYTFKASEQFSLFGQAGISLSLLKITDFEWEEEGDDDYVEKYNLSTSFGYNVGGGLIINDKLEIGLKYYGLGEHEVEGEFEYGTSDGDLEDFDQEVSLFMLTLGFRL